LGSSSSVIGSEFPTLDGFVKSPSAALRFIFRLCGVRLCTPHSARFARLASGAFYCAVHLGDFLRGHQTSSRVHRMPIAIIINKGSPGEYPFPREPSPVLGDGAASTLDRESRAGTQRRSSFSKQGMHSVFPRKRRVRVSMVSSPHSSQGTLSMIRAALGSFIWGSAI
jgi:hypothetical protein